MIATDLMPPNGTVEKIGPAAHAFQLDVTQEEDWCSVWVKSPTRTLDSKIKRLGITHSGQRQFRWTPARSEAISVEHLPAPLDRFADLTCAG